MKKTNIISTLLKVLLIIAISVALGVLLMAFVYSIPLERIIGNARDSIIIYSKFLIQQWAGYTRYSHLSNSTDQTMINAAICRPYESIIENSLLNPYYTNFEESCISLEGTVINFPRYWHGYLIYIIPLLLITNAGGIRTMMMIIQYLLSALLIYELGKRKKIYIFIYAIAALFINPITSSLSFQDADIYIIMILFSIIILKYNDWLKHNNRYIYLFTINGIIVSFIDYLTFPLVAWGIPLTIAILVNKDNLIKTILFIIICSLSWIAGYVGMWAGKWVIATLFTNINVIEDAINQVGIRTVGDNYTYIETLKQIFESVNDVPMITLYLSGLLIILVYAINKKMKLKIDKNYIVEISPFVVILLGPFAWYFVVRNHSYGHPWFEYRELAVSVFCFYLILLKTLKNN